MDTKGFLRLLSMFATVIGGTTFVFWTIGAFPPESELQWNMLLYGLYLPAGAVLLVAMSYPLLKKLGFNPPTEVHRSVSTSSPGANTSAPSEPASDVLDDEE